MKFINFIVDQVNYKEIDMCNNYNTRVRNLLRVIFHIVSQVSRKRNPRVH
jgi:hypothetical protein